MKIAVPEEKIKCSLCGHTFDIHKAQQACKNCILTKGCSLIRCPHCNYEMPLAPAWLKKLFKGRKK